MTIVGSLLAVLLSMKVGFDRTLLAAVAIYLVAVPSFLLLTKDSSRKLDGEETAVAAAADAFRGGGLRRARTTLLKHKGP